MASGNTLCVLMPHGAEFPASDMATLDVRNNHPCLDFDATTGETAYWTDILPRHYAGGGLTIYIHYAASTATSGTAGFLVAIERIGDGSQDVDSDGFASNATVTAVTVPGTSGHIDIASVAITDGANIDSIAVGELFRIRITRDVANDTAAGDIEIFGVEIKET